MLDFTFDETQRDIKKLAGDVLSRTVQQTGTERETGTETGFDKAAWDAMATAGLLSLAVPEKLGGAGLGVLETAVVLAEVGRVAAPVPAVATLALGVLPIALVGTEAQQEELLKDADSGRVLTAALSEPSAAMPRNPSTTATREGAGFVVSGTKVGVMAADAARRVLVSVGIPGEGSGIVLVDPAADGVALRPAPTSGAGDEFVVQLDGVRVAATDLLGGRTDEALLDTVHGCAVAGICAAADGSVGGALDLTAEHLRTRTQFGRPLATFQAVAQQIAEVYVAARTLSLATWSACWRLDSGLDAAEDLDVAALWLADEAPRALQTCHHLHGGLGVDVTYPLHRHSGLIRDLVRAVGGADDCLDRLAEEIAS